MYFNSTFKSWKLEWAREGAWRLAGVHLARDYTFIPLCNMCATPDIVNKTANTKLDK